MKKLKKLKPLLTTWNKEVFGDLRLIEAALTNRVKELDSLEGSENWNAENKAERERLKKELCELMIKT